MYACCKEAPKKIGRLTARTSAPSRAVTSSRATLPALAPGSLDHRFSRCRMSSTEGDSLPACTQPRMRSGGSLHNPALSAAVRGPHRPPLERAALSDGQRKTRRGATAPTWCSCTAAPAACSSSCWVSAMFLPMTAALTVIASSVLAARPEIPREGPRGLE